MKSFEEFANGLETALKNEQSAHQLLQDLGINDMVKTIGVEFIIKTFSETDKLSKVVPPNMAVCVVLIALTSAISAVTKTVFPPEIRVQIHENLRKLLED